MNGNTLAMIFQKTSTRTRVSFEAGISEMGGHAIYLDWRSTNFTLSKIKFESKYLSRNAIAIAARVKKHEDFLEMAEAATVPVINACCNMYHPCQALADMLTILADRGNVEGTQLTFVGVYNNVVNSLVSISLALGVKLTLVCPVRESESIDETQRKKLSEAGLLVETLDVEKAVENADYVYTDTWLDMEFFADESYAEVKKKREGLMLPYQLNHELLKNSKAKVMHDMPIHPGYEISEALVDDESRSIIYNQAENRLDAQKAILLTLTKKV